ncbi:MAG: hypothetical protein LBJ35_06370 [Spirochaetaceae bacterium]|jgi:hypothetical protein|nr:hypothetical protein [Spirochaetaceae bacterium]
MTIVIDGIPADIRFENEKTLGDVLSGIEEWVDNSGFCLSRVFVDGEDAGSGVMDAVFTRNIDDVKILDIVTRPYGAFYGEALTELVKMLNSWRENPAGRKEIETEYKKSPSYSLIAAHDKELLRMLGGGVLDGVFSNETFEETLAAVNTRLLEAEDPVTTFLELERKLDDEAAKLSDLPLDLQTGHDKRAAQTIQNFSNIVQKMFRLLPLLQYAILKKTDAPAGLLDEFKSTLKEFAEAYENKDMVLSGDLAEYELSPRIKEIYAMLKEKLPKREFENA